MSPQEVIPLLYDDLRKLASAKLTAEKPGHTLDATALVHEAWLKLSNASIEWADRTHFLRTAATAMRRILVDRARAKLAARVGPAWNWEIPALAGLDPIPRPVRRCRRIAPRQG